MTIRVLVVDDQALLRAAFSSLIDAEEDLEVAGQLTAEPLARRGFRVSARVPTEGAV